MTVRVTIEAAGPLTSVQDRGRAGWRRYGVPPSGPVDRAAFAAALAALGLSDDAAIIEVSLGGLAFRCEDAAIAVALTGGAEVTIDGVAVGGWCVVVVPAGARCSVTMTANWGYVAFAGEIDRPAWLGSRATHLIAGLGGGRVAAGDTLLLSRSRSDVAAAAIPVLHAASIAEARVVLGPQERFFHADTIAQLLDARFVATTRFDRMGMALDGPPLVPTRIDMPSEPTLRGALQVDGAGQLSLLTADHQTTGGYPRIGVVIDPDVDRLAQLPPGAAVRFAVVEASEAVTIARAARTAETGWVTRIAAARRFRPSLLETNLIDGMVSALDG